MKFSFCIITIGKKKNELSLLIKSIHRNFANLDYDYEIIIVGNNLPDINHSNIHLIEDNDYVEYLGKRRNIATENASGDILVHCDDDLIFPDSWLKKFLDFYKKNPSWQVASNKVLLPDGMRYWDRNTYKPYHRMVDYEYESDTDVFYLSGCFGIFKKSLLNKICWNDSIPFYGMMKGYKYNEDVEFSIRLHNKGVKIFFDKNNLVWHNDFSYLSNNIGCGKNPNKFIIPYKCIEFVKDCMLLK